MNFRVRCLLDSLKPDHFKDLTAFCARELCRGVRLPGAARELFLKEAADLLHDAIESLLVGLRNPNKGHHPNAQDVESLDSFTRYLRNVVRYVLRKHVASAALRQEVILRQIVGIEPTAFAHTNPAEEAELGDLKQEFFKSIRFELNNPGKYSAALEIWHEDFFNIDRLTQLGLNPVDTYSLRLTAHWIYFFLCEVSVETKVMPMTLGRASRLISCFQCFHRRTDFGRVGLNRRFRSRFVGG
jgi:hypothetical protein